MHTQIPPISDVQQKLKSLGHAEMHELSRASGVPFTTLWKIRDGVTKNPGIETVRVFLPHIDSSRIAKAPAQDQATQGA